MSPQKKDSYKVIVNWDEGNMYCFLPVRAAADKDGIDAQTIKTMLEDIVDEHAKAKVDVLVHQVVSGFMSVMPYPRLHKPSGGGSHIPATVDEHHYWCEELGTYWITGFRALAEAGLDILEIIRERCRKHNIAFIVGFRANDRHAGSGTEQRFYPRVQQMQKEHPEWMLKEFPGGVDYKYEGVRDAIFDFMVEATERYDLDGIEIDWMRWCHVFNTWEAVENAPILVEFVRRVRKLLDDAAEKRGRERLPLGVRVPQTIDECTALGYDVASWVKQGLVDYICPADFYYTDYNTKVEDFVAMTEGTECEVYPSVNPRMLWESNIIVGVEEHRAAAKNFYAYGARGVSAYNYQQHWDGVVFPSDGPFELWPGALGFLTELKSDEAIGKGNRRYLYYPLWSGHTEGHGPTRAYKNDRIVLDRGGDDPQGSFTFRLAEDLTNEKLSATLEFKVAYMIEIDELEITINGQTVPAERIQTKWHIGQSRDQADLWDHTSTFRYLSHRRPSDLETTSFLYA